MDTRIGEPRGDRNEVYMKLAEIRVNKWKSEQNGHNNSGNAKQKQMLDGIQKIGRFEGLTNWFQPVKSSMITRVQTYNINQSL